MTTHPSPTQASGSSPAQPVAPRRPGEDPHRSAAQRDRDTARRAPRVPGEISTASGASTTGTTQAGCTRYRPGSATCRPATAMIALATGHQCSPRSAAGAIPAAGWRAGFRHVAILHNDRAEREPGPSCPGDLPSAVRAARWGQSRRTRTSARLSALIVPALAAHGGLLATRRQPGGLAVTGPRPRSTRLA
jgi:hypothetical protein